MRCVAERVTGRRAVGHHAAPGSERKERPQGKRFLSRSLFLQRLDPDEHEPARDKRAERGKQKRRAPAGERRDQTGEREGKRGADAEERGVEGDIAALRRARNRSEERRVGKEG